MDKNIIIKHRDGIRKTTSQSSVETFEPLIIPPEAYKEFRRCPHCESVFIDDNKCEACGKVLNFNPLGEPLGPKSFYGLKEKYVSNIPLITRFIPSIENKNSPLALNYKRHLDKRFALIADSFCDEQIFSRKDTRLFYNELKDIIVEKITMGMSVESMENMIVTKLADKKSLMSQELVLFLHQEVKKGKDLGLIFGLKKSFILKTVYTLLVLVFFCLVAIYPLSLLGDK